MTKYPKEYKVQPFLRPLLWFLFYGFLCFYLFISMVLLTGGTSDPASFRPAIIIMLVMLPCFLPVVYFLYQNYGKTILTNDEIISRKFGMEKRIRYSDIVSAKEKDFNFPTNIVVKSANKTIRISNNSCNFGELYDILINKIAAFQTSLDVEFPWILEVKLFKFRKWFNITGLILIWGIPLGLVYSLLPSYDAKSTFYIIVSFVVFWGLISWLCIYMYLREEWSKSQPCIYRFMRDHIEFQMPLKSVESVSVEKETKIELINVIRNGIAPGEGISVSFHVYSIGIILSNKRKLIIDGTRAKQFGYTTLKIYQTLLKLYPHLQ